MNNVGLAIVGPTDKLDLARFDALFASNVRAPFLLAAGFVPGMAARGRGSIINIGSMAGTVGLVAGAAYGATKAAIAAPPTSPARSSPSTAAGPPSERSSR